MTRSKEYLSHIKSPAWYKKSLAVKKLSGNRCVLFPWLTAKDAHHMTYRNLGRELPVIDLVPLSHQAHKLVHNPLFWDTLLIRMVVNYLLRILYIVKIIVRF